MPSSETFEAEEEYWMGTPNPDLIDLSTYMQPGGHNFYEGDNTVVVTSGTSAASVDAFVYNMDFSYSNVAPQGWMITVYDVYDINSTGYTDVALQAHNTCGWSGFSSGITFAILSGGYYMMMSPNPTTVETSISIESNSEQDQFDETEAWDLEVYSPSQTLKEKKTKLKGNKHTLKTQGWKEGIYIIRVKYKDLILQEKLIVK